MIEIKDIYGNSVLKLYSTEEDKQQPADAVALGSGSVWVRELGGKDCIKLKFSLGSPLSIGIGYHIEIEPYGRFTMTSDYSPEYNAATGGYDYEVTFDAWYYAWNRYILKLSPEFGAQEASFSLTTTIADPSTGGHLGIIKRNIEHYFKNTLDKYDGLDVRFEVMYKTEGADNIGLVENVAKTISYDNVRITDALSLISQAYECEWWVEGNVIYFGRCDKSLLNEPRTELNIGHELASLSRANSSGEYATRIYAFGSTRNVSARYRKSLIFDVKETGSEARNYPDDGTEEWKDRSYVIDTARKIQPIWYDPECRIKASKSTLVTLPGLMNVSIERNRKQIETISENSVCKISKGSVTFKPIVNVTATNCNKVSVQLTLSVYDTDSRDGNLVQEITIGPKEDVNEVILGEESAVTFGISDTCYVFSAMCITVEGAADGCKVSCVAPMMNVLEDNYYIQTSLNVIDSDNNVIRIVPVIANPFFDLDYSDEAARLYLPYGETLAVGTRFTLDNVIKGKVPVGHFTDDLKRDVTITSFEKRLMLPIDKCPGNYIDSPEIIDTDGNVVESEIVESVVVFEDVYPKKEVSVTEVSMDVQQVPDATDENPDGKRNKYLYRLLIDKDEFYFDSKYILSDGKLSVAFQSGKLAGMEFEAEFEGIVTGTDNNAFLIINNENYAVELPNAALFPEKGDKVVFFNYDVSLISDDKNSLVASAEKELYDKAVEYLKKSVIEGSTYTVVLMSDYAYGLNDNGEQDKDYSKTFRLGDTVHLGHEGYFGTEGYDSRIIGIEVKIDIPYDSPSYTIGESSAYSRLSDLESKISQVKSSGVVMSSVGGGGSGSSVDIITSKSATTPTDSNVFSALASNNRFLSKTRNDTANGRIIFAKSADFGQFVSGIIGGIGGRIDSNGNAELESLVLRSFLEVPELRFNRIDVVSGELWNSIAFGTISSVTVSKDGTGGTAWVHLEETERCGLKVGDICRGIFSDFGDGRPADESDDGNGFKKTYGFSTAYFTPTSIIKNEEGEFGFNYQIQPGTKVHPCAYMKFAVYGSFTDPSRRASAYFTRSYMRYLKNVQTWRIDPDRNIASQFGNLDGLTIGGMHMQGEGTFLSNIYMTGAIIQFTPEQKEELKGQDSYSVVLSDYECVLHVNEDGYVRDINRIRDVVVSSGDVMAMKGGKAVKVVDLGYNATAAIQVYRGKDIMHHAPVAGELAYTVAPSFFNCEGFVTNGVLIVTKIVDTEQDAYVDMEVNCEGNAVFSKHFAITVVRDAASPVTVDLDNDMDTVVENPLTGDITGSPLTSTAMMRYGTDEMEIVLMSAVEPLPDGIGVSIKGSTATITVGKDAGAASAITLRVTGRTAQSETLHTREVHFIANKVKSQYQLKLVPSVAEVKVDADGTFNGTASAMVKCQALINDGTASVVPATYAELKGYRARMFYGVNVTSDVPDFSNEVTEGIYANGVSVSGSDDSVTFWLYYYPNGIDTASGRVRFDMETIHVLHDAADSFTQFVFKRVNAESVAAPEGGSYSSSIPEGWSDGVPAGDAKLWMSRRKFTSNGKNQDAAWSTPRPMSDTADFDVCFHDAVSGDGTPAAPPKSMHPTQTGMSGNNGWYDDGKTTSEWIATATCSNGVWSDWSVVKIVGESPVIADIDNEMDGIGVGSDGILDAATTTSTNVFMYHGSRLMHIRSVSASGLPSGVTASAAFPSSTDHSRCTVTFAIAKGTDFSAKSRHSITLTIIATYNDVDYTRSLTYTLLGTTNGKDGEVYFLQPSTTAVTRDKDLAYHPASVTCARYVKKGQSDAVASSEGELTMSTDGGSSWKSYAAITSFSGINAIIYRWTVGGVEIDRETVPVILDGESALSLRVSQTQGSVQLTNDGALITTSVFLIEVKAFYGVDGETITSNPYLAASKSGISLSVESRSWNKADIQLTISGTGGMDSSDRVVVSVNVPTNRGTLSFDFSIQGVRQGKIGKIARYCGTFVEGSTYYGSADESGAYVDIVYHETKKAYLQCVIGGKYTTSQIITNQDNSSSYNWLVSSFEFIATKVFFAELAYIRNLALVNMVAGYYDSDNNWIPMIEIDGNGNLLINKKGYDGLILNDGVLKMKQGNYVTSINTSGIGHSNGATGKGFSLAEALLRIYNSSDNIVLTPEILEQPSKSISTTWENVINIANGPKIVVREGSLPSTTEANTLYVVI